MKRLYSLLLVIALAMSLAACGSPSNDNPSSPGEENPGGSSVPEAGQTVVLDLDGEPSSLNPCTMGGSTSANLMLHLCYGFLWQIDSKDEVRLDLAESYELDTENLLLTVHLREGLTFADGSALTAEDVVCSFQMADRDNGNSTGDVDFERTRAVDDTTVEIGFSNLSTSWLVDFSVVGIVSKEWTEDGTNDEKKGSDILCSGPYVLEPWTTGNDMVYVKNERYWDVDNVKYDQITVKCIGDETTRFLDYSAGGVDICLVTSSTNMDDIENGVAPGSLCLTPTQIVNGLIFDTTNIEDFSNQNLRLALCYAIDVPTLVKTYCGDRYTVATSTFPVASAYYSEGTYTYDPELAQQYLDAYYAETGADSVEFTCTVKTGTIDADLAQAMQYSYSELGITMNIEAIDNATYFDRQSLGTLYSTIGSITRGYYDPAKLINSWRTGSGNSIMYFADPGINEEIEAVFTDVTSSEAERKADIAKLQADVIASGKFLPLYEELAAWGLNGSVNTLEGAVSGAGKLTCEFWLNN